MGIRQDPPAWRAVKPMIIRDGGVRVLGGAAGSRTPDLFDANEARYQLRYSPECPPRIPGRWIRDVSVVDRPAMLEDAVELAHLACDLRLDARCGLIDLVLLDRALL